MDINYEPPKESEATVEDHLYRRCLREGWMCEKFTSPNRCSVPDRLITRPGNRLTFVECKSPKGKLTSGQIRDHERRRKMGCDIRVVYSRSEVNTLVDELKQ